MAVRVQRLVTTRKTTVGNREVNGIGIIPLTLPE